MVPSSGLAVQSPRSSNMMIPCNYLPIQCTIVSLHSEHLLVMQYIHIVLFEQVQEMYFADPPIEPDLDTFKDVIRMLIKYNDR